MFVKKDDVHKPIVALNSDGVKRRKRRKLVTLRYSSSQKCLTQK